MDHATRLLHRFSDSKVHETVSRGPHVVCCFPCVSGVTDVTQALDLPVLARIGTYLWYLHMKLYPHVTEVGRLSRV